MIVGMDSAATLAYSIVGRDIETIFMGRNS
jgi:hypothetical protein